MMKRKLTLTTQSLINILIVIGILVVINTVSQRGFLRWDLTKNKQYTISSATKNILKDMDDRVTIKLFFSKNLPPVMMLQERRVRDLLDEYRAYSKGKIVVQRIDPASSEDLKQQVRSIGIPEVQMTFREKDKVEVKNGYLGMGIFYLDRTEVIPIVQNVDNLEYDLTSAIRKVSTDTVTKIGFLAGKGERDIAQEYSLIQGALRQQYETTVVTLDHGQPVPSEISMLIIAGPREEYSDRDLFEIDQFVMRGGKLVVMLDTVDIDLQQGLSAKPLKTGLEKLLEHYGIRVNTDFVLDRYNDRLTYSESPDNRIQYVTTVQYPFFVKVTGENFSDNPILRGLQTVTLPWTSSIDYIDSRLSGAEVTTLLKSSEMAWTQSGWFKLNPKQNFQPTPDQIKQYNLCALVSNQFSSFFAGKEIPKPEVPPGEDPSTFMPPDEEAQTLIEKSPETQIFVIGNSHFATMDSLRRFQTNGVFFLNAVDWLAQGEALIGIRTRAVSEYPIDDLSDGVKARLKFLNVFLMPALVAIFGLLLMYFRIREKKLYEAYLSR